MAHPHKPLASFWSMPKTFVHFVHGLPVPIIEFQMNYRSTPL